MLRSILVGLDGSAYGKSAMELGIRWAQNHDALLVGLGIIDKPGISKPGLEPLGGGSFRQHRDAAMLADARRRVEQFLGQFALRCSEAGVSCKLLEEVGAPEEQIVEEAQRYDLIMLGQQTFFQFETQEQADSTLVRVLKDSPRPVVTAPEKLDSGTAVVVAYDGSLQASHTLQAFVSLGLAKDRDVHVLTIGEDKDEAVRCADRAVEYLGFHGVMARRNVIESTAAAPLILDAVKRLNAGLLVMGAYGKRSLREFFFGSVTQSILRDASVPLFLYH